MTVIWNQHISKIQELTDLNKWGINCTSDQKCFWLSTPVFSERCGIINLTCLVFLIIIKMENFQEYVKTVKKVQEKLRIACNLNTINNRFIRGLSIRKVIQGVYNINKVHVSPYLSRSPTNTLQAPQVRMNTGIGSKINWGSCTLCFSFLVSSRNNPF